jgi:hypothetical protein
LVGSANFIALTIPFHRVAIITNSPKAAASAKVPTAIRFQVIAEQTFIGLIHRNWNDRLNIMFLTHDIRPRPHLTWLQFHYLTGKSQAISQANDCGNGFLPENVGCQNTASQIQGDENVVVTAADQAFP